MRLAPFVMALAIGCASVVEDPRRAASATSSGVGADEALLDAGAPEAGDGGSGGGLPEACAAPPVCTPWGCCAPGDSLCFGACCESAGHNCVGSPEHGACCPCGHVCEEIGE